MSSRKKIRNVLFEKKPLLLLDMVFLSLKLVYRVVCQQGKKGGKIMFPEGLLEEDGIEPGHAVENNVKDFLVTTSHVATPRHRSVAHDLHHKTLKHLYQLFFDKSDRPFWKVLFGFAFIFLEDAMFHCKVKEDTASLHTDISIYDLALRLYILAIDINAARPLPRINNFWESALVLSRWMIHLVVSSVISPAAVCSSIHGVNFGLRAKKIASVR